MNEQIKSLMAQAGIHQPERFDAIDGSNQLQKFAELIVRECALHLHKRGVEGFGILEERNLKEHFGVEE